MTRYYVSLSYKGAPQLDVSHGRSGERYRISYRHLMRELKTGDKVYLAQGASVTWDCEESDEGLVYRWMLHKYIKEIDQFLVDFGFKNLPDECLNCTRCPDVGSKWKEREKIQAEIYDCYEEKE